MWVGVEGRENTCERLTTDSSGFKFDLRSVPKDNLEEEIMKANEDETVDGIIVYYPIFPQNPSHDKYVQETVDLAKDVEGMRFKHLHNMYHNVRFLDPPTNRKKSILPCTPLAVVKILEYLQIYNPILAPGNRLFGKTITVINRSEVNGRPLAALLANDGATVYSVDITGVQLFTRGQGIKQPRHQVEDKEGWGLEQCLPASDVVISGVPSESYKVPTHLIRDGATCINFSSHRNFDGPAIKEKASLYVPSVGKVTIAALLRNLVVCPWPLPIKPPCPIAVTLTGKNDILTPFSASLPTVRPRTCRKRTTFRRRGTRRLPTTKPRWLGSRPFLFSGVFPLRAGYIKKRRLG